MTDKPFEEVVWDFVINARFCPHSDIDEDSSFQKYYAQSIDIVADVLKYRNAIIFNVKQCKQRACSCATCTNRHSVTFQKLESCKDEVNISTMSWSLWNKAYENELLMEIIFAIWMLRSCIKDDRNAAHLQNYHKSSFLNKFIITQGEGKKFTEK
jgi:hypothetical protein